MLELNDVCWHNARGFSIDHISFTLEPGRVTALMGPNGAGKSTILKLLTGEYLPSSGSALLDGLPVQTVPRRRFARQVAVIRQERSFTFPMRCVDLVLTGRTPYLGFMGRSGEAERRMARESLARTGALPLAEASFEEISGGEKQRVMLARALMQEPKILLLDEAFSAMDARQSARATQLIHSLSTERNIAVMCILHDIHIAHAFADRLLRIENGRITADGTPDEVAAGDSMRRLTGMNIRVHPDGSLTTRILPENNL